LNKLSTEELHLEIKRRERSANRLAARREKLLAEVASIDAELAGFGYEAVSTPCRKSRAGGGRKRPRNEMNLVDTLAKALKGKTMWVSEAAEAVTKLGYRSSSANFRNIVNQTLLKHNKVFKKVGRGQYTAK